jgi:hypothetical protein
MVATIMGTADPQNDCVAGTFMLTAASSVVAGAPNAAQGVTAEGV